MPAERYKQKTKKPSFTSTDMQCNAVNYFNKLHHLVVFPYFESRPKQSFEISNIFQSHSVNSHLKAKITPVIFKILTDASSGNDILHTQKKSLLCAIQTSQKSLKIHQPTVYVFAVA